MSNPDVLQPQQQGKNDHGAKHTTPADERHASSIGGKTLLAKLHL
jgi:hypothetical protein